MLKSLFKQPYKVVSYRNFFLIDILVGSNYFPVEYEIQNPYPVGQNVFMFPEESNVLVKKIKATFIRDIANFGTPDKTIQNWVVNYQLLNRTDGFINDYPTRNINSVSGDWNIPGGKPVVHGVVNTSHPSNDFGPGVVAGGIRVSNISALGQRPLVFFGGNLIMDISVYYQDLDEKK
jgi:hypothetical protein